MKRKSFTPELKAKVALEAVKGHKTTNELASEFDIHPTQINAWKKQLLEGSRDIFGQGKQKQAADFEKEQEELYSQIGRLKVEVDWLKKKTGHLG